MRDIQTNSWLGFRHSPGAYHIELVLKQLCFLGGLHAGAYQVRDLRNYNINSNDVSFEVQKSLAIEAVFFLVVCLVCLVNSARLVLILCEE